MVVERRLWDDVWCVVFIMIGGDGFEKVKEREDLICVYFLGYILIDIEFSKVFVVDLIFFDLGDLSREGEYILGVYFFIWYIYIYIY